MSALVAGPPASSALARRNPTVKLAVLLLVSLVVLFIFDPFTPTVLYLLALAGTAVSIRVPARTLLLAHLPFAVFAVGILLVNTLSRPGAVLWQSGMLRVTEEGLSIGAALGARTLLIGVMAIAFLLSTDPVTLMTSLHHNARLGPRLTYALLAGYRMLQEMPREWTTIQHAHAVRSQHAARARRRPRHLARVIFTLLVVSVRKGERLAQALESRGLGLQPRTTWRPVPILRSDWALLTGALLMLAAVITSSAALGVLQGPGALSP